ncbi:MAG: 2Fe-2S iron-sulfur cluster binding domain-containing protein [Burkholderiaceae bacterium]
MQPNDRPFTVRVVGRDTPIAVGAQQTLLEALREHGFPVRSSCESGTCGTCRTAYQGGRIDHRDLVLSEQERRIYLMPCISRPLDDDVVLDLAG